MPINAAPPAGQSVNETGAAPFQIACLVPAYPVGPVFSRSHPASVRPGREDAGWGFFLRGGVCGFHTSQIAPIRPSTQSALRLPFIRGVDGNFHSM